MKHDVLLRPITEADLELVRTWRNSPEVSKYMYSDQHISEEDQIRWYRKVLEDSTTVVWIIEFDGRSLGVASLNGINKTLSSCYWAFYLGDSSVRGAGIGAKVEYQVMEYVFGTLGLNKLRCEVFSFNDKVIKMHEKFGFRREAYYREHCRKNGKYEDVVGLAILRSEWTQISPVIKQRIYGG